MIYPRAAVRALSTWYLCRYDAIHPVYDGHDGRAIVLLMDITLGN